MRTPSPWDDVFLAVCRAAALRSKDDSSQFGAVLVSPDHRLLATGFNGPPPQLTDADVPWETRPDKYSFVIHAEENAILFALDAHGFSGVRGSTLYVNGHPCPGCVLRAIRAGVARIKWADDRRAVCVDGAAEEMVRRVIEAQAFPKVVLEQIGAAS